MGFDAADLDKILKEQRTARGMVVPELSGRKFLRSFGVYMRGHIMLYTLGLLFLLGMLGGVLLVSRSNPDTLASLKTVLGGYLERRQTLSFSGLVASTFCSTFVALAVLFFCGFCTIASPIIFAVPLFKGLGYGFSIGMLYAQYGSAAIRYVLILLMPALLLSTLLLLLACRSSLKLSISLFRSTLVAPDQTDPFRMKRHCIRYVLFTVFCLLIALMDAVIYLKFAGSIIL